MRPSRLLAALLAALPLALLALVFAPSLFAGRHFFLRDVFLFSWPEKAFTAEALRHARLPLWDPRLMGGVPHLSYVTYGVLDPLNVLLLLFPLPRALDLLIAAHAMLGAAFTWLLARRGGLRPAARALAAILYTLGGPFQGLSTNPPYLFSAAWLPAALWALERLAGQPCARNLGLLALALAATFLAGDPELVYLLLLFAPLRLLLAGEEQRARRLTLAALAVVLFLALVAIVFLPALELLGRSERAQGVELAQAQYWSLHPLRLVELVVPLPFDSVAPRAAWWGQFLENYPSHEPWVLSIYLGAAVLLLALLGLRGPFRSLPGFLALGGLAGLLLALGAHTPVYGLLHDHLPGFDRFRYPAKAFLWTALALALLAARGLEQVHQARRLPLALAAALGLALLVAARAGLPAALVESARRHGAALDPAAAAPAAGNLARRLSHAGAVLAAAGALPLLLRRRPRAAVTALLTLAAADLTLVTLDTQAWAGDAVFQAQPPLLAPIRAALGEARDERVIFLPEFADIAAAPPLSEKLPLSYLEQIRLRDVLNLGPNLPAVHGLRTQGGFLPARPAAPLEWWRRALRGGDRRLAERALQVSSTRVVVAAPAAAPGLAQLANLEALDPAPGLAPGGRIFSVRSPRPRAYVVGRAVAAGGLDQALDALAAPGFDLAREVIVEGSAGEPGEGGSAEIRSDEGHRLLVQASAGSGGGWLVVTDSWDPGWRAWVGGQPAPVLRANGIARAVRLPPGPSVVRLEYAPGSFRLGRVLSAAALLVCLALLLVRSGPRHA